MVSNPFADGVAVKIDGDASGLNAASANAVGSLGNLKTAAAGAGLALAALAAGGLAKATQASMSFSDSIDELSKRVGEAQAEAMADDIRKLATELPVAAEEIAAVADDAARFGIEGEDRILQFTETVIKMGEATKLSTDEAAEAFAKLSTMMDVPVDQTEKLGSAINTLSNTAAASSQEIVEATLKSSAALNQMGLAETEILGVQTSLLEVSESARRAGTRLRRLAQEMQDPKKAEKFAAAMGMSTEEFERMRDENPKDLLLDIVETFDEGGQKADALRSAMGSASQQAVAGLASNLDGLQENLQTSNEEFEKGSSLQQEFAREMEKFSAQQQILVSQLREIGRQIGNNVLPFVRKLMGGVSGALDAFLKFNKSTGGMAGTLALVGGLIGGLATAVAALAPTLASVAATVGGSLAAGLSALLGPIGLIIAAVAGLALAWQQDFLGIQTKTMQAVRQIEATLQPLIFALKKEIPPTLTALKNHFNTVLTAIQGFWKSHGETIMTIIKPIFTAIKLLIENALDYIITTIRVAMALIRGDWKHAFSLITKFVGRFVGRWETLIGDVIDSIAEIITTGLGLYIDLLTSFWGGVIDLAVQGIVGFVDAIVQGVAALPGLIMDGLQGFVDMIDQGFTAVKQIAIDIVNTIAQMWLDGFNRIIKIATEATDAMPDWVQDKLGVDQIQTLSFEGGQLVPDADQGGTTNNMDITVDADTEEGGRAAARGLSDELNGLGINGTSI